MSKKALEAFNFISEKLNGLEHYEQAEVNKHLDTILQALNTPTAEEVCEALSDYLGEIIIFNSGSFMNEREITEVCAIGNLGLVYFNEHLPPHLVTLVERFYEGFGSNE